jgi:glycosyltransferase involved in cell wall biosynthesis
MKLPLSVCMIVKNEEENISNALESIADIASEIIVVDTGSTDKTKEIANSYGAKVHHFDWINDFSAARNESLKYATKDWILIIDADHRFEENSKSKLPEYLNNKNSQVYYVQCVEKQNNFQHPLILLFRNNLGIHFEGEVHERATFDKKAIKISFSDLYVLHFDPNEHTKEKNKRNRELILKALGKGENEVEKVLRYEIFLFHENLFDKNIDSNLLTGKITEISEKIKSLEKRSYEQSYEAFFVVSADYFFNKSYHESFLELLMKGLELFPSSVNLLQRLFQWFFITENYLLAIKTADFILYLIKTKSIGCYVYNTPTEHLDPEFIYYGLSCCYYHLQETKAVEHYISKILNPEYLNLFAEFKVGVNRLKEGIGSYHYFFRAKSSINTDLRLSSELFFKALEIAREENRSEIELLIISNLILFSSELNLENDLLAEFINKGKNDFGFSLYFWYCLGSHYLKISDFHGAIKTFETAYKTHSNDLLFNFISSESFKSVNLLVKDSQEKGFYFEQILKGLKAGLNKLKSEGKI